MDPNIKLINEVRIRPVLWDRKTNDHHNRFILDKFWDEVAKALRVKRFLGTIARKKWKALRDKFRITLASFPKSESGDYLQSYVPSWKYFKSMEFLIDQFKSRTLPCNIDYDNLSDSKLEKPLLGEMSPVLSSFKKQSFNPSTPSKKDIFKKRSASDENEIITEDDEDMNFFKSILPHIKYLSTFQKISYRMKILQTTQQFLKDLNPE